MPNAREPLLDAVVLAAQDALIEREFSLADFSRLRDQVAEPTGKATMRLALHRIDDVPTGRLVVTAEVKLVCQRCLQPMTMALRSESEVAFAAGDSERVPAGYELIAGDPKRVDLAGLVEDELLLALPPIPRHAAGETCRLPGTVAAEEPAAPEMRRPFAGLKDLLKH
jgi:uncharacterized protein